MSQLLAMEMGKNDDNIDTGNSEISSGRQRREPSGTKLRTLQKVKELKELPSTQNIPNKLTCARPTLKQFKQEQLVGRRQLKEVEFPKARGAPYTDLGTDNRNMPAMELLLKAPHGDVIRATLGTEEMNVMPSPSYIWKDKDKDNERGRQSEVLLMMQGDHDSPEPSISLSPSPIVSVPLKDIEEASTDKNGNSDGLSLRKALSLHVLDAADLVAVKSATLASLPNQILPPACNRKILGSSSGSNNRNNLDWDVVQRNIDVGDVLSAFSVVLERGELEDLARIMEILGPKPHVRTDECTVFLSISLTFFVY